MPDLVPVEPARRSDRTIRFGGLLRDFMAFNSLLIEARAEAVAEAGAGADSNASALASQFGGATGQAVAMRISARLETVLSRQWDHARRTMSDRELGAIREVQFLMCALADDLFLHEIEWRGREAWSDRLLEQRVFGTRVAGEQIFEQISALVQRRDPAEADLASVYLAAIGLGFKGRFRSAEHAPRLDALSRMLFDLIAGRAADPTFGGRSLVPGAIANVISGERRTRASRITVGTGALLGIAGAFVFVSSILWFVMTSDLVSAATAVLRAAE